MDNRIKMLLVGQTTISCQEIRKALRKGKLKHKIVKTAGLEKVKALLKREKGITVVLCCEQDLRDGTTWREVLEHAKTTESRPSVIVCSRLADERLWAEALNLGAHDVLRSEPVVHDELARVIGSAHRFCPQNGVSRSKTKSAWPTP